MRQPSKTPVSYTHLDVYKRQHQIRSYVLDQSRIKDLRTNVEVGNTPVSYTHLDVYKRQDRKLHV